MADTAPGIAPADAAARMDKDGDATYIDVRTVPEFTGGRPRGRAINVPIEFYHPKTGDTYANKAFLLVVKSMCETDQVLIVGADAGTRATRAAGLLQTEGYESVLVMDGGIDAWRDAALPVTGDNRDGVSYVSLLTPARRAADKEQQAQQQQ